MCCWPVVCRRVQQSWLTRASGPEVNRTHFQGCWCISRGLKGNVEGNVHAISQRCCTYGGSQERYPTAARPIYPLWLDPRGCKVRLFQKCKRYIYIYKPQILGKFLYIVVTWGYHRSCCNILCDIAPLRLCRHAYTEGALGKAYKKVAKQRRGYIRIYIW